MPKKADPRPAARAVIPFAETGCAAPVNFAVVAAAIGVVTVMVGEPAQPVQTTAVVV